MYVYELIDCVRIREDERMMKEDGDTSLEDEMID